MTVIDETLLAQTFLDPGKALLATWACTTGKGFAKDNHEAERYFQRAIKLMISLNIKNLDQLIEYEKLILKEEIQNKSKLKEIEDKVTFLKEKFKEKFKEKLGEEPEKKFRETLFPSLRKEAEDKLQKYRKKIQDKAASLEKGLEEKLAAAQEEEFQKELKEKKEKIQFDIESLIDEYKVKLSLHQSEQARKDKLRKQGLWERLRAFFTTAKFKKILDGFNLSRLFSQRSLHLLLSSKSYAHLHLILVSAFVYGIELVYHSSVILKNGAQVLYKIILDKLGVQKYEGPGFFRTMWDTINKGDRKGRILNSGLWFTVVMVAIFASIFTATFTVTAGAISLPIAPLVIAIGFGFDVFRGLYKTYDGLKNIKTQLKVACEEYEKSGRTLKRIDNLTNVSEEKKEQLKKQVNKQRRIIKHRIKFLNDTKTQKKYDGVLDLFINVGFFVGATVSFLALIIPGAQPIAVVALIVTGGFGLAAFSKFIYELNHPPLDANTLTLPEDGWEDDEDFKLPPKQPAKTLWNRMLKWPGNVSNWFIKLLSPKIAPTVILRFPNPSENVTVNKGTTKRKGPLSQKPLPKQKLLKNKSIQLAEEESDEEGSDEEIVIEIPSSPHSQPIQQPLNNQSIQLKEIKAETTSSQTPPQQRRHKPILLIKKNEGAPKKEGKEKSTFSTTTSQQKQTVEKLERPPERSVTKSKVRLFSKQPSYIRVELEKFPTSSDPKPKKPKSKCIIL